MNSGVIALLPHINGALNGLTVILLLAGLVAARRGARWLHRTIMMATLAVSAVFLASYLTYHFNAPIFQFAGQGWVRPLYYSLLIIHVILAIVATPLVLMTAWRGLTAMRGLRPLEHHRRFARWVWPLWFVVAVTGVAIYGMLYHLYPAG
jgi:uncharacterized membrane protein YozB (DUF420 family)